MADALRLTRLGMPYRLSVEVKDQIDATDGSHALNVAEQALGAAESMQQPPFTPFASRDDFLSTPINVDIVSVRARVGDETLGWLVDPAGPIISTDGKRYRPDGPPRRSISALSAMGWQMTAMPWMRGRSISTAFACGNRADS